MARKTTARSKPNNSGADHTNKDASSESDYREHGTHHSHSSPETASQNRLSAGIDVHGSRPHMKNSK